jgi:hypothetical protein
MLYLPRQKAKEAVMMEKFIPYEKLSKKKRRELDAKRREVWTISPITRKPDNPKAYKRKKIQRRDTDESFSVFFCTTL